MNPFSSSTIQSLIVCVAAASSLPACEAEFAPGSEVDGLRVLAVRADQPFAAPGETVRLSALTHDSLARPLSWAWALCAEPASSSVESCLLDVAETTIMTGTPPLLGMGAGQDTVELEIPGNALDGVPPSARPAALVGVLSVACPGTLDLAAGAQSPLLPFRCVDADTGDELGLDEAIVGVKRVFLRDTERNANPVIERILLDGEEWAEGDVKEVDGCDTEDHVFDDCGADVRHRVQAVVSASSFESGTDEFGRSFTEQLIVQHYTEQGLFEDEVRIGADSETGWVARSRASGSELRLWFVARDDRGGVTWAERRVRVR